MILAVRVHILPQQGDFFIAISHCLLYFPDNIFRQTAALPPPHIWHDAIGAEIIAAVHDWHPGRQSAPAEHRSLTLVWQFRFRQVHIHHMLALCFNATHRLGEGVNLARAQYEVDMRRSFYECFTLLLGHATGNAKDQFRLLALQALDFSNLAIDLVLCCFPDTASIDEDEVCLLHILRLLISNGSKLPRHALTVRDIPLTAINYQLAIFSFLHVCHACSKTFRY